LSFVAKEPGPKRTDTRARCPTGSPEKAPPALVEAVRRLEESATG
jgi:hypothetical protein